MDSNSDTADRFDVLISISCPCGVIIFRLETLHSDLASGACATDAVMTVSEVFSDVVSEGSASKWSRIISEVFALLRQATLAFVVFSGVPYWLCALVSHL